jgi:hypothetical protein
MLVNDEDTVVDVKRIIRVLVIVVDPEGELYTAREAVPTIITMPTASTLTSGDNPFLVGPQGRRLSAWRALPLFLRQAPGPNAQSPPIGSPKCVICTIKNRLVSKGIPNTGSEY